jgi:UrcA family protein
MYPKTGFFIRRSRSHEPVIVAGVVGAVLMLGGLPAFADGGLGVPITVKYKDVDPASTRGAAVLYERIRSAAVNVCSPLDHGDLLSKQHVNSCVQVLVEHAVTSVGTPALQAVYAARYGATAPNSFTAAR